MTIIQRKVQNINIPFENKKTNLKKIDNSYSASYNKINDNSLAYNLNNSSYFINSINNSISHKKIFGDTNNSNKLFLKNHFLLKNKKKYLNRKKIPIKLKSYNHSNINNSCTNLDYIFFHSIKNPSNAEKKIKNNINNSSLKSLFQRKNIKKISPNNQINKNINNQTTSITNDIPLLQIDSITSNINRDNIRIYETDKSKNHLSTKLRKDQEAYEREIENTIQQIKFVRENPQVAFLETFYKTAYPNDKRRVIIPTEEKVHSLDLDRMYEIYRERFAFANNQIFFFVGNVSDSNIAMIAKYLNHLPTLPAVMKETLIDRSSKFATGIVHAEAVKGIERQGMLLMMGQKEVPNEELDTKTRMAIQQLGDALGITTLEIIREKNGDAYSPSGTAGASRSISSDKGTVYWQYYIGLDPEKAKKVEKDCIKILKQYIKKGCDQKTLSKVQEQMIVQHDKSIQNNSWWLGQIKNSYMTGEDADWQVTDYNATVKSITIDDIKAVAAKYLDLNNYISVTLRPEDGAVGTAD